MPIPLGILAVAGAGAGGGGAFDLLETTLISTNTASVTFSSLGSYSDYKHLQIRLTGRSTRSQTQDAMKLRFNSDSTSSNYAYHYLRGNSQNVSSAGSANFDIFFQCLQGATSTSNFYGASIIDILDFSNTNKNKTVRALSGLADPNNIPNIDLASGLWKNTSAVTSIDLLPYTGPNFAAGTRISLYGLK